MKYSFRRTQAKHHVDVRQEKAQGKIQSVSQESALDAVSSRGIGGLIRLSTYAQPHVLGFALIVVLAIIFNVTGTLQPYLVKVAIDDDLSLSHPNVHGLAVICCVYIVTVIVGVAANYTQVVVLQYIGQSIIRSIRLNLFQHITRQALRFFDKTAIGRLVTTVSNDTENINQFFTQFFLSTASNALSIIMIVFAMYELNGQVATYSMVVVPIVFAISFIFRKRMRRAYQVTRTRLSRVIVFLAENLAGIRIIQLFRQEKRQAGEFERLNSSHRDANVFEYGTMVSFNRVLELLANLSVAAMIFVGGDAVLHHVIKFGTLYAFISYIKNFFAPINAITQQWNTLLSALVSAERIGNVFRLEPAIQDPPEPIDVASFDINARIEFCNVFFAYEEAQPVLQGINFTIEPGMFVGFVGATGAGKSSVMSLLMRFYDASTGQILIGGRDVRDFRQVDLHSLIGLVQQDVYIFSGSIADNIRLFRPDISDKQVVDAAVTVGAHRFIDRLPNGYNTKVYAKGTNLSMGERQLIAFARIVAFNPRVLILDEATANLDSQTEEWVQAGLQAVAKSRTTLVIAHRLSTIRNADTIFVMDKGRIVEQGNHEELLSRGEYYATLHANSGVSSVHTL